jgi:hypothetical protein
LTFRWGTYGGAEIILISNLVRNRKDSKREEYLEKGQKGFFLVVF